jgi:hypothetical protein
MAAMIDDARTTPPMPEWNDIPQDIRARICDDGELLVCPCCGRDAAFDMYHLIRDLLKEREERIFRATMAA